MAKAEVAAAAVHVVTVTVGEAADSAETPVTAAIPPQSLFGAAVAAAAHLPGVVLPVEAIVGAVLAAAAILAAAGQAATGSLVKNFK